jgi:hypothetical protein
MLSLRVRGPNGETKALSVDGSISFGEFKGKIKGLLVTGDKKKDAALENGFGVMAVSYRHYCPRVCFISLCKRYRGFRQLP